MAAIEYPATTIGFLRRTRSDHQPEIIFMNEAVASATPSMSPMAAGPAWSVRVRKSGRSGKIMSEAVSDRKETQPKRRTPRSIWGFFCVAILN